MKKLAFISISILTVVLFSLSLFSCDNEEGEADPCTHVFDNGTTITEADCTNDGSILFTCTLCQATKEEVAPKKGHYFFSPISTCLKCNAEDDHSCEHSLSEEYTIKEPSCVEYGEKGKRCTLCNSLFADSIPLSDHTIVDKKCTVCGKNQYSVTFDPNGGSLPNGQAETILIIEGERIGRLPSPTKEGCIFNGWFEESDTEHENKYSKLDTVDSDLRLVAHWETDPSYKP